MTQEASSSRSRLRRIRDWVSEHLTLSIVIAFLAQQVGEAVITWEMPGSVPFLLDVTRSFWHWAHRDVAIVFLVINVVGIALALRSIYKGTDYIIDRADAQVDELRGILRETTNVLERVEEAARIMSDSLRLDDALFYRMAGAYQDEVREQSMPFTIDEMLKDLLRVLGPGAMRASLWVPNGDWLAWYAHYKMPAESLRDDRWYIGDDPSQRRRRGTAGEVFLSRESKLVYLPVDATTGKQEPSDDSYVPEDASMSAHYCEFLAYPILFSKDEPCLGVLCVDSAAEGTLSEAILPFVVRLAGPLALLLQSHDPIKAIQFRRETPDVDGPATANPIVNR